jgi:hypothetical protein
LKCREKGSSDVGEAEDIQGRGALEDGNVRCGRSPEEGIGGAEEDEARDAAGGGEVADAGVVADEIIARGEARDQVFEREVVRGGAKRCERGAGGGGFGFAGDDEEFSGTGAAEPRREFEPAGQRPVFLRGTAAGVESDGGGS